MIEGMQNIHVHSFTCTHTHKIIIVIMSKINIHVHTFTCTHTK